MSLLMNSILFVNFTRQKGMCYWTDFPIDPQGVFISPNPLAPSLERLDESLGYVRECCYCFKTFFNLGRRRCPESI